MKKIFLASIIALAAACSANAINSPKATGDTTVVVTVSPIMHCVNCEKKIKSNIRFVKGVKSIETNRDNQTVTLKMDRAKYNRAELDKAFAKIGYKISESKGK